MSSKNKFDESEKVLCFHGALIYEAKILEYEVVEKGFSYLVHYAGWSKTWDEWVPEHRVLKFTDENKQTMRNVRAKYEAAQPKPIAKKPSKSKGKSESTPSVPTIVIKTEATESSSSTPSVETTTTTSKDSNASAVTTPVSSSSKKKKRKRVRAAIVSEAEMPTTGIKNPPAQKEEKAVSSTSAMPSTSGTKPPAVIRPKRMIIRSDKLKQFASEDWFRITKLKKLYDLPAKICIEDIFDEYEKELGIDDYKTDKAVVVNLRFYINHLCKQKLLYNVEKEQFDQLYEKYKYTPTEIYGVHYLLRLLVILPQEMITAKVEERAINKALKSSEILVAYIEENIERFAQN